MAGIAQSHGRYNKSRNFEINGLVVGAGDGCFSWRDWGLDDDPQTLDLGTWNDDHDSFDTNGDGDWNSAEISEFFRSGKVKQWENGLNQDQKNLIEQSFKKQMIELGYI